MPSWMTVLHRKSPGPIKFPESWRQCETHAQRIRQIILGAHSTVAEGIKWNGPSFRTTEYFATVNLRARGGLGVILHLGAKVRDTATTGVPVEDPNSLLQWLAKDRATVMFTDAKDIEAKKAAFENVLRQWLTYV